MIKVPQFLNSTFSQHSLVLIRCCLLVKIKNGVLVDWTLHSRGLHGSKNLYPNPKRPVNVLHGTDPDPTIIRKLDPNPAGKTQTRLHPSGTYCTANAIKSINKLRKKPPIPLLLLVALSLTAMHTILLANKFPSMLGCSSLLLSERAFLIHSLFQL